MNPNLHVSEVRLHDYLDGELPHADARSLEDHVVGCARCRTRLADLAELRTALGALPLGGAPARDLWPGIERRLDPGRDARILALPGSETTAPGAEGAPPPRRSVPRPLRRLAYAAGLVAAFGAGALAWRAVAPAASGPPASTAEREAGGGVGGPVFAASVEVRSAIAELEEILDAGRSRLDPATLDVLDRSLATIDAAIAEAEAALAEDPASPLLRDLLLSRERAKVRVLTRAATRLLPST